MDLNVIMSHLKLDCETINLQEYLFTATILVNFSILMTTTVGPQNCMLHCTMMGENFVVAGLSGASGRSVGLRKLLALQGGGNVPTLHQKVAHVQGVQLKRSHVIRALSKVNRKFQII